MKAIGLWSGGKDSCFACYLAIKAGHKLVRIVNFASSDAAHSISHGLSAEVILRQAKNTGFSLLQKPMPDGSYRDEFIKLIRGLKEQEGIKGVVFGDIYLQEHKDWIDNVCQEAEVEGIFPVWGRDTLDLINEMISSGFRSLVVASKPELLGENWLGREIDHSFIRELPQGIDPCGEKGEFHTFTFAGPLFQYPVEFKHGARKLANGHWFLEIC